MCYSLSPVYSHSHRARFIEKARGKSVGKERVKLVASVTFSKISSYKRIPPDIILIPNIMVAVLVVLTSHEDMGDTGKKTGWYLPELAHPYYVFKKAGYDMTFVSPKGGKAPLDPGSLEAFKEDPICKEFYDNAEVMKLVDNTTAITSIDPAKFDVIFCVGGHGPMFDLPNNDAVNKAVAVIYEKGGIASAVCHGPAGIVNTKLSNGEYLVKGQKVTGFTDAEEEAVKLVDAMPFLLETKLREHGAQFENAPLFQPHVCASNRVVTGQNPASATPMAEKIVELLQKK